MRDVQTRRARRKSLDLDPEKGASARLSIGESCRCASCSWQLLRGPAFHRGLVGRGQRTLLFRDR